MTAATLKGLALAGALGTTALLAGCGKGSSGAGDTMAARGSDTGTVASGATTPATTPAGSTSTTPGANANVAPMTDPQIFATLAAANTAEIDQGKLAETKATNADVKAFAQRMVHDHTQLLDQGHSLAQKLNITPSSLPNDSLGAQAKAMQDKLQGAPKGMAFDTTYINGQVMEHQQVLTMLQGLDGKAQQAQVNDMIKKAQPTIQSHLDRAKSIQQALAKK